VVEVGSVVLSISINLVVLEFRDVMTRTAIFSFLALPSSNFIQL
jgi:hypothetical protein